MVKYWSRGRTAKVSETNLGYLVAIISHEDKVRSISFKKHCVLIATFFVCLRNKFKKQLKK